MFTFDVKTTVFQVIDVLKDIKDTHHFELFSSMLIFLKSVKPTEKVVKKIIFLQNFEDQLVSFCRQISSFVRTI